MQKQEKILTLFKNILFILKAIKGIKINTIAANNFKLFFINKLFILKRFINKKKFKNLKIRKQVWHFNKFIYKKFKDKEKFKNSFFNNIFLFNKPLFKNINSYSLFLNLERFKVNKNILYFFVFKLKKFNRFFFSFLKKKYKKNISIFIKRNNFFYTTSLYFKRKLIFVKNSYVYKKTLLKQALVKKLMFICLKNSLIYFTKKYKIKKVIFNFFLKKKRRLKKKGLNKHTINFIDSFFFINMIKMNKFFKKLKIIFSLKLHFIKSHSVKTEKLKKRRRK